MCLKKYLFVFTAMCLVFLLACQAGKQQHDIGIQLYQSGKYKEAIPYLKQAIEKEPDNELYRNKLKTIEASLIQKYVEEAQNILTKGEDAISIETIEKARSRLKEAKSVDPDHPDVVVLEKEIKQKEDNLLSHIDTMFQKARQHMDQGEWIQSYFLLQQIQNRFPNYEDSFHLMNRVVDEGAKAYYQKAETLFEKEKFNEAAGYLNKAISLKPGHKPSRQLLAETKKNDSADYFISKARNATDNRKWDTAVVAYTRALEYDPDNEDIKRIRNLIQSKAGSYYIDTTKTMLDEGKLFNAFKSFTLADEYLKNEGNLQLASLARELTAQAARSAEILKDNELYGSAWYWYKKIEEVNPDYPNLFQLTLEMEDKISERVKKSIAVFDFNSPAHNEDAGIIVANNLITYLFKNASGDIKILERENLQSILEEMKLGQLGVVSSQSAKEMGRVYGIDVAIMGSVLLFQVDSNSSKSKKSVRYQVGTKIEDNIDFLNWKEKNPDPSDEQIANAPPAKISKPVYREKDYEVSTHKKVGFVQLSFRIVDVTTGENIQVKTLERKVVAQDSSSAGVPEANIKFDPLEIPTDTEMLQQMTEEVVSELGREVLRPLQNLEKIYYQEAVTHLRRRDQLPAAEAFVNSIFDEKLKMIQNSPVSTKAWQNLDRIFKVYRTKS